MFIIKIGTYKLYWEYKICDTPSSSITLVTKSMFTTQTFTKILPDTVELSSTIANIPFTTNPLPTSSGILVLATYLSPKPTAFSPHRLINFYFTCANFSFSFVVYNVCVSYNPARLHYSNY